MKQELYGLGVLDCEDLSKNSKNTSRKKNIIINVVKEVCKDKESRNKLLK